MRSGPPPASAALRVVLGLARHGGDWRSSPTALYHLATTFRERCGLPELEVRVREVSLKDVEQLRVCAVVLLTSNDPIPFGPEECAAMSAYAEQGGLLWVNDSSATGDERMDTAFRQALARIFPRGTFERLEHDHPLLRAAYDLSRGYKGYPLPPGDKYREEFARGVRTGAGRNAPLGLLYTRNDYADGLEIDPRMKAGMKSLTDLQPDEMLEGSLRFGINVVAYALGSAAPRLPPPPDTAAEIEKTYRYKGTPIKPFDEFELTNYQDGTPIWGTEDWGSAGQIGTVWTPEGREMKVTFKGGEKAKVVVTRLVDLDLGQAKAVVLDLFSALPEGINASLLFATKPDWDGFETRPIFIRPGWNRNLRFPLTLGDFKSSRSQWKNYDTAFEPRVEVGRLSILLYNLGVDGEARVDNLRIEK
jgi:hypothetical protein